MMFLLQILNCLGCQDIRQWQHPMCSVAGITKHHALIARAFISDTKRISPDCFEMCTVKSKSSDDWFTCCQHPPNQLMNLRIMRRGDFACNNHMSIFNHRLHSHTAVPVIPQAV